MYTVPGVYKLSFLPLGNYAVLTKDRLYYLKYLRYHRLTNPVLGGSKGTFQKDSYKFTRAELLFPLATKPTKKSHPELFI